MKVARVLLALGAAALVTVVVFRWTHPHQERKPVAISFPGCSSQVASWTGITADLQPIYQEERLIRYFRSDGIISTWKQRYEGQQHAWITLAGYALAGLRNAPPACVPEMRQNWRTAMTDFLAATQSWSQHTTMGDNFAGWQLQGADSALQLALTDLSSVVGNVTVVPA